MHRSILKFVLVFIIIQSLSFAQETNKLDDKGKRHGKWLVYLDNNWKRIDDSTKATYKKYTYYDHGVNIYPMGPCGKKGYRLESSPEVSKKGNYIFLEGKFTWFNKKGKISSEHVFKNGEYISCKEYYPTGELEQFFDYTKKCEEQQHGWTVTLYNKDGTIKLVSPTCKDSNGNWPVMRD